jgi:hypothetical protein
MMSVPRKIVNPPGPLKNARWLETLGVERAGDFFAGPPEISFPSTSRSTRVSWQGAEWERRAHRPWWSPTRFPSVSTRIAMKPGSPMSVLGSTTLPPAASMRLRAASSPPPALR